MNFLPLRRASVRPSLGIAPQRAYRKHQKFVRGFVCVCFGKLDHICSDRIECAHYRTAANSGKSLKPHDAWTFPACSEAHAEQHRIGQLAFQKKYGLDLPKICQSIAKVSPVDEVKEFAKTMVV